MLTYEDAVERGADLVRDAREECCFGVRRSDERVFGRLQLLVGDLELVHLLRNSERVQKRGSTQASAARRARVRKEGGGVVLRQEKSSL